MGIPMQGFGGLIGPLQALLKAGQATATAEGQAGVDTPAPMPEKLPVAPKTPAGNKVENANATDWTPPMKKEVIPVKAHEYLYGKDKGAKAASPVEEVAAASQGAVNGEDFRLKMSPMAGPDPSTGALPVQPATTPEAHQENVSKWDSMLEKLGSDTALQGALLKVISSGFMKPMYGENASQIFWDKGVRGAVDFYTQQKNAEAQLQDASNRTKLAEKSQEETSRHNQATEGLSAASLEIQKAQEERLKEQFGQTMDLNKAELGLKAQELGLNRRLKELEIQTQESILAQTKSGMGPAPKTTKDWVDQMAIQAKLNQMKTQNPNATWGDAALAMKSEDNKLDFVQKHLSQSTDFTSGPEKKTQDALAAYNAVSGDTGQAGAQPGVTVDQASTALSEIGKYTQLTEQQATQLQALANSPNASDRASVVAALETLKQQSAQQGQ